MMGRCERARLLREKIAGHVDEGLAGHVDLSANAVCILAAAQALMDAEWDIEFHTPEPERPIVLERPRLRLVNVTKFPEGEP